MIKVLNYKFQITNHKQITIPNDQIPKQTIIDVLEL
jgi:hypothetical protein